jgi:MFS family permease
MVFTWYQISIIHIGGILEFLNGSYIERMWLYGVYSLSYMMVSIIYPNLTKKRPTTYGLYLWVLLATISSLTSLFLTTTQYLSMPIAIAGIALGLGIPCCLSYFADCTETKNRGRTGGIIFFFISLAFPLFSSLHRMLGLYFFSVFSVIWMVSGLIFLLLLKPKKTSSIKAGENVSMISILANKQFYLYFIAWIIYSFIDNLEMPILRQFLVETFGQASKDFMLNIGTFVTAFSIFTIGFLIDLYGRKRALVYGFISLGIAYAFIGINPSNLIFWYLYFIISGAASGFFIVIFVFTVWGDISPKGTREKYYAIGSFPYFFIVFISELLVPYITLIPAFTAFAFASFFLFLAVLPLMYAPETLPETEIKRRELREYIEKAKKIRGNTHKE